MNDEPLIEGRWYWVNAGGDYWFPAQRDTQYASGGWTNTDTCSTVKNRARKGGSAKADSLSKTRRRAIAKAAAAARWQKKSTP